MHWLEDKALWPLMPMGPRLPRRCPPHRTHYEKGAPYKTIGVEFGRRVRDLYVQPKGHAAHHQSLAGVRMVQTNLN
jgi:hypothetical protein